MLVLVHTPPVSQKRRQEEIDWQPFMSPDGCWYLLCGPDNNAIHTGHAQMIPSLLDASIATFDEESLELAIQCTELCLDNSTIAKLVNLRTKGCKKFTPDQIKYILSRHEAEKIVAQFDSSKSSAQQLLDDFESLSQTDTTLKYVAMIHLSEEGYYIKMPARV